MEELVFALHTVTTKERKAVRNSDWLALLKWEESPIRPVTDRAQVGVNLP